MTLTPRLELIQQQHPLLHTPKLHTTTTTTTHSQNHIPNHNTYTATEQNNTRNHTTRRFNIPNVRNSLSPFVAHHVGSTYQTLKVSLSYPRTPPVPLTKLHTTLHSTITSTTLLHIRTPLHTYSTTYVLHHIRTTTYVLHHIRTTTYVLHHIPVPYHSPPHFFTKNLSMLPFCIPPVRAFFFDTAAD